MDPDEDPALTWEKARVLPRIFQAHPAPGWVVAFGTAACPQGSGQSGSVVIGSNVFVHDPYAGSPDPAKHWTHPRLNQIVPSSAAGALGQVSREFTAEAEKRFLTAPLAPASPPRIRLGDEQISIGVVNVTKTEDYTWADPQALERFKSVAAGQLAASSETTHGVIRLASEAPFLYVSGIANGLGKFTDEVLPRNYAQNFVAAHNAAIATVWLLAELLGRG
jgi:hypothetical protein